LDFRFLAALLRDCGFEVFLLDADNLSAAARLPLWVFSAWLEAG
jgi:hypothetical protein